MYDSKVKLLYVFATNDKALEKFKKLNFIYDMYDYCKELVHDLTEEEFLEFILESIFLKNNYEKISDDSLNKVAGGINFSKFKPTSLIMAIFTLCGNIVPGVSATDKNISNYVTSIKNTVHKKYDEVVDLVSKNPKIVKNTLISIGAVALSATVIVGSIQYYKNSDNFFQRTVIGSDVRGTKEITLDNATAITIDNRLKGYRYSPKKNGIFNGKYVIFYSGSGSSNTYQMLNMVDEYTNEGATVIGVDYDGFGDSGEETSPGKIREKRIYSDAQTIYNYVRKDLNISSENIIIHGFSLGGPVAAHVAANVSKNGDKIDQLILQSSMKNTTNAAYGFLERENKAVRILGTVGAYLFADQFDCEKELKRLFKFNPGIHVVICGGDKSDGLNLEQTKLNKFADEKGFKNLKIYNGNKGHLTEGGAPVENFMYYDKK